MNKITKILIPASFLILPIMLFILPDWKEILMGFAEFIAELAILIGLFIFYLRKTNIFFVVGILVAECYYLNNAIDINRTLFILFVFWAISNEFSMWLAQDLIRIINGMFISKEHLNADRVINFQIKPVIPKHHIFEISQIISSYNGLVEQTNKLIDERIAAEKRKSYLILQQVLRMIFAHLWLR